MAKRGITNNRNVRPASWIFAPWRCATVATTSRPKKFTVSSEININPMRDTDWNPAETPRPNSDIRLNMTKAAKITSG